MSETRPGPAKATTRPAAGASWTGSVVLLSLVLVVALSGAAMVETRAARRDVAEIVASSEQVDRLIERIALTQSRLRALALESYTEAQDLDAPASAALQVQAERFKALLRADMAELERRLDPSLQEQWRETAPFLRALHADLVRSIDLLLGGEAEEAEELLDEVAEAVMRDSLSPLAELERGRRGNLQQAVDGRLRRLTGLELAFGGATIAGLVLIGVARARAERRHTAEVARAFQLLEAANRDLDQFAGRTAHDLRNVIAPVGLLAEVLRRDPSPEAATRAAARLEKASAQASAMIEALLTLSRAGRADPDARADVEEVTRRVTERFEPAAAQAGVTIERAVAPGEVACDPVLLGQAVGNLVDNAIKHMGAAEERRLRVEGRLQGEEYVLAVRDTGPGIAPEAAAHLFEPFFRDARRGTPGLGLGLATVHRIVDVHGGSVEAEPAPGGGARFVIRLPGRAPARVAQPVA